MFVTSEKFIHSRKVNIKLINAGTFIQGHILPDNLCYFIGTLAVLIVITADDNGFRTQSFGCFNGHGTVYTEFSCFIAACSHYTAFTTANDYRLPYKFWINKPRYRNKKAIHIHVYNA